MVELVHLGCRQVVLMNQLRREGTDRKEILLRRRGPHILAGAAAYARDASTLAVRCTPLTSPRPSTCSACPIVLAMPKALPMGRI